MLPREYNTNVSRKWATVKRVRDRLEWNAKPEARPTGRAR